MTRMKNGSIFDMDLPKVNQDFTKPHPIKPLQPPKTPLLTQNLISSTNLPTSQQPKQPSTTIIPTTPLSQPSILSDQFRQPETAAPVKLPTINNSLLSLYNLAKNVNKLQQVANQY